MWRLRHYVVLWIALSVVMARDYLILNKVLEGPSLFVWLADRGLLLGVDKVTPKPGQPLSFLLGWLGFGTIAFTNFYVLRKRASRLAKQGSMAHWLDFHIFCGLLGPTLILFHTNLHVHGLVAVSFWSMIISFLSGVVGRYFYVQLLSRRPELRTQLDDYREKFKQAQTALRPTLSDERLKEMKRTALERAGVTPQLRSGKADLLTVLLETVRGDLTQWLTPQPLPQGVPQVFSRQLRGYATLKRREITDVYYQRIMGYWHAFHLPFAVFMYVVTFVHIIAALVFRAN